VDYCTSGLNATIEGLIPAEEPALTATAAPLSEDARLAQALRLGSQEAAALAWKRFQPLVYRTLRRMLGPSDDIADLTQDVFFRFFNKVLGLRSLDSLRSFVIGIAFRRGREEIRRRQVRRSLRPLIENHFQESHDNAWNPEGRHALARVWELLERLGQEGHVYALRYLEGRELADIASRLEISVSTVRRCLIRAAKKVERLNLSESTLDGYFAERPPVVASS
jgi:RNA polymerase sigma-70 factor, ECF subfamily